MLLGQILTQLGYCTEKDILQALDLQREGDSRFIGEILIWRGKITREQLKHALDVQFGEGSPDDEIDPLMPRGGG